MSQESVPSCSTAICIYPITAHQGGRPAAAESSLTSVLPKTFSAPFFSIPALLLSSLHRKTKGTNHTNSLSRIALAPDQSLPSPAGEHVTGQRVSSSRHPQMP